MPSGFLRALAALTLPLAYVMLSAAGGLASPLGQAEPTETAFEALPEGNADLDSPRSARTGDVIEIGAEGFTPGAPIVVVLMGPGPAAFFLPVESGSPVADGSGRARWRVRLPATLVAEHEGTWWLNADDADGHFANRAIVLVGTQVRPREVAPQPSQPDDPALPTAVAESPAEADAPPPASDSPPAEQSDSAPDPSLSVPRTAVWARVQDPPARPLGQGGQVVTSVALRVRTAPSVDAELITTVAAGTPLLLLGGPFATPEADYYRVRLPDGTTGYASLLAEDMGGAAPAAEPGAAYRLRMEPSTGSEIRALVPVGTLVQVLIQVVGEGGAAWSRVRLEHPTSGELMEGYLPNSALRFV